MQGWLAALLVGAAGVALLIGAKVGAWWAGRRVHRLEERVDQVELERDVAQGEANVAAVKVEVLADHAARQEASVVVAEELRDAAPASLDPDDRVAALRASVRAHARGEGPVPGPRAGAAVRPPPASGSGGDDDGRR